jgi:magnesium transporter
MLSLTDVLDVAIRDPAGTAVARLHDVIVRVDPDERATQPTELYPPVIGLVAHGTARAGSGEAHNFIPWTRVRSLEVTGVQLNEPLASPRPIRRHADELPLREAVLDRFVVDIAGRRLVRVNDLLLDEDNGAWRLVAVDGGTGALVRRLGLGRLGQRLSQRLAARWGRPGPVGEPAPLLDWAQVVPVTDGAPSGEENLFARRVRRARLRQLAPADLAHIVGDLTPRQGAALLDALDPGHAADTLEEFEDEDQARLLHAMDPERAADVLEAMEPDEAADALQGVSDEEQANLLARMDREQADIVEELTGYPPDSAGGLMTTDYVSVPETALLGAVARALRERVQAAARGEDDPLPEALPEVYVIAVVAPSEAHTAQAPLATRRSSTRDARGVGDPGPLSLRAQGRLVGSLRLRDLFLSDPDAPLTSVMQRRERVAHPSDRARYAARIIAEDDLIALPVVDQEGTLLGIVTVDDAMDVILPAAWKQRVPHRFR